MLLLVLVCECLAPAVASSQGPASQTSSPVTSGNSQASKSTAAKPKSPELEAIQDDPELPRVLLIGDSISMGYTLPVRQILQGRANVHRPPTNCSSTGFGLANIEKWLGDKRWQVIHFNFGLHDAKQLPEGTRHTELSEYQANLRKLVALMQAKSDKVIFATTTPVPMNGILSPIRRFDSIADRNSAAIAVMQETGVAINDLHALVLPVQAKVGRPNDVHFGAEGSELLASAVARAIASALPKPTRPSESDVVVYGGTSGGVMAALAAAQQGKRVTLIEPGRHLGGMTTGGLGATDFGKGEAVGGLAREFYRRVKQYYQSPTAWKHEQASAYTSHRHDPNADVMWHFEPHVAEKLLDEMLSVSGLKIVRGERLDLKAGVKKNQQRIASLVMESGREFRAQMFIDATYEGDLMAKAGVSYHVGRESNSVYGETMNGVQTRRVPYNGHNFFRPVNPRLNLDDPKSGLLFGVSNQSPGQEGSGDRRVQAYCFRLCMTEVPSNRVPFEKPADYDASRYELMLRYLTSTGLFPDHPEPRPVEHPALGYRPYIVIMPNRKTDSNTKGAVSSNLVGGNYDYPDGDYATRERITQQHKNWQMGMLWFLQNDPRVPEEYRSAMQSWGLAKDEFVDTDHWPHQLYVREARRMIGQYVMTEMNCDGSRPIEDPVGLGSYNMDSHVTQRYVDDQGWVRNEGNIGGRVHQPYAISYRSLIPKAEECENLLVPVCCSASHVAYGSIRMEPVYMILGQSAGIAAVRAIEEQVPVQKINYAKYRAVLESTGQRF